MAKPLKSINYYKENVQNNMSGTEKNGYFITRYISNHYIFTIFSKAEKSFSIYYENLFPHIMKKIFHQHKNPDI